MSTWTTRQVWSSSRGASSKRSNVAVRYATWDSVSGVRNRAGARVRGAIFNEVQQFNAGRGEYDAGPARERLQSVRRGQPAEDASPLDQLVNDIAGVACLERGESFLPTNAKAFTHYRAGYTHAHPEQSFPNHARRHGGDFRVHHQGAAAGAVRVPRSGRGGGDVAVPLWQWRFRHGAHAAGTTGQHPSRRRHAGCARPVTGGAFRYLRVHRCSMESSGASRRVRRQGAVGSHSPNACFRGVASP